MRVGDGLGNRYGHLDVFLPRAAALDGVDGVQELQEEGDVVRRPEQEEDDHYGDDQPHDAVPFRSLHVHQRGDDAGVANHHHHHRKHQAQHVHSKQIVMHPVLVFWGVIASCRPFILDRHVGEDERWQRDAEAQHPD